MSIAAEKISSEALFDLLDIFDTQPWMRDLHVELAELWNGCETREEQHLLKFLLKKFFLLDAQREKLALEGISKKIQGWGLTPDSTWIIAVANKDEIDGSSAGLQKLKNKIQPSEDWHSRFISNIPSASGKVKAGDAVILFDDFIGTGGKMIRKTNWLKKLVTAFDPDSLKFYYTSFSGMQFGMANLAAETNCASYAHFVLTKALSEDLPKQEALALINVMKGIEGRLGDRNKNKHLKDYSLGFEKSESLYCGQNDNCPNNVFPVFWWPTLKDGSSRRTPLRRAG